MTTLFDSAAAVNVAPFALGLSTPARPARRKPFSTLDAAWYAGFTAGQEDGPAALPPADMSDDEAFAWYAGRESAVLGSDDAGDWDHGQLEAAAETAELQELHERGIKVF